MLELLSGILKESDLEAASLWIINWSSGSSILTSYIIMIIVHVSVVSIVCNIVGIIHILNHEKYWTGSWMWSLQLVKNTCVWVVNTLNTSYIPSDTHNTLQYCQIRYWFVTCLLRCFPHSFKDNLMCFWLILADGSLI